MTTNTTRRKKITAGIILAAALIFLSVLSLLSFSFARRRTAQAATDYDSLMTNLKNGRLHQVVEKLFEEGIRRGTITFNEDGSASFMPII